MPPSYRPAPRFAKDLLCVKHLSASLICEHDFTGGEYGINLGEGEDDFVAVGCIHQQHLEAAFRRHAEELESPMDILDHTERRQLYSLLKRLGLFAAGGSVKNDKNSRTRKGMRTIPRKGRKRDRISRRGR